MNTNTLTLSKLIESVKAQIPEAFITINFDTHNHDEIVLTVRTGLVEPADGQQLHTVEEIIELYS
jgi:hypothetical protein